MKRNYKTKSKTLKLFGINAAGIKSKLQSFNEILSTVKPQIWMIEETKLKPHENLKCEAIDDFQVFYLSRQKSQGGGVALGVNKIFESTLLNEGDDETEVISVLVMVGSTAIRVIVGYGPQENASKDKKEKFWEFIENEVVQAESEHHGVIIQIDGNLHAGDKLLKDDPNPQNQNGKLFMDFLKRNCTLSVVNSMDICEGLITRQRSLETRTEKAVLDFFIVNEKLNPYLKKMIIDEKREYSLGNYAQFQKNKRVIESDHNGLLLELELNYSTQKPERKEFFNFRNKVCQEAFKRETDINRQLLDCFENELSAQMQSKIWLKTFNSIIYKCFRKVRMCKNKKEPATNKNTLLRERKDLLKNIKAKNVSEALKRQIEDRISQIENEIGTEIVNKYHEEIIETINDLGGDQTAIDGSGRQKLWKVLKRKIPKIKSSFLIKKKEWNSIPVRR